MTGTDLARRAARRVIVTQFLLAIFAWGVLGAWSARSSWLLEREQEKVLRLFFVRDLPALGFLLVVLIPAIRVSWLGRRLSSSVDVSAIDDLLRYPRAIALLDLAASILLFAFAAIRVRLAEALPIESAKIASFGTLGGVLFAVLSYGLLQTAVRPLLRDAIERGGPRPAAASFPLTQKLVLGGLAIAFVVGGLFGELALYRAERNAERTAGERASEALSDLLETAPASAAAGAADWNRFLASADPLRRGGTVFALDRSGSLVGFVPASAPEFDRDLLRDEHWRRALLSTAGIGAVPMRVSEPRMVSLSRLHGAGYLGVMLPPDAAVMKTFVQHVTPVAIEVLIVSIVLAVTLGKSLARPLRVLERQTREFGRDPAAHAPEIAPTDDEIGVLVHSSLAMRREIREVQARLRETERRAATAELLAGVAHEVRNPLFGITSAAAALERVLSGDPKIAPHLGLIARESRRLSRMMEDMLMLQRVPGRSVGPLPVVAVLRAAEASVRTRHPGWRTPVDVDASTEVLLAHADRDRIESVFSNLFENAVFACEEVRIRCRVGREDGFAAITVEDDGPGVPDEIGHRAFEPFVTSRPGGTGLGLALCRQIVAEHGGAISMESAPGRTIFTVRLPAV